MKNRNYKSTVWMTPTTNIKDHRVVDDKKVEKRTYDSDMDVFTFYNKKYRSTRRANLMDVSVYDDVIVEGDVQYVILCMLSKPESEVECCHH